MSETTQRMDACASYESQLPRMLRGRALPVIYTPNCMAATPDGVSPSGGLTADCAVEVSEPDEDGRRTYEPHRVGGLFMTGLVLRDHPYAGLTDDEARLEETLRLEEMERRIGVPRARLAGSALTHSQVPRVVDALAPVLVA